MVGIAGVGRRDSGGHRPGAVAVGGVAVPPAPGGAVMRRTTALLWKEWLELRLLFAISLFVFLGLPLIGSLEDLIVRRRFELSASLWVFLLRVVLAIVVGVGTVVRDLNGRLEDFWRSRPVSVTRWLLVKYFVGLAAVLASLIVPLAFEIAINRKTPEWSTDPRLIMLWSPFLWAALYSIAFAIACVIRRGAQAAMLSIAALLLLYFLPTVLPPLRFLSLAWPMGEDEWRGAMPVVTGWPAVSRQVEFVAGMLVLSAIGLIAALIALRRDWRVESGRKVIYWSIGGALLILFSSAAFQVASNLPLLQTTELPPRMQLAFLSSNGSRGILVTRSGGVEHQPLRTFLSTFHLTGSAVQLDPPVELDAHHWWFNWIWNPQHTDVLYLPRVEYPEQSNSALAKMKVVRLHDGAASVYDRSFPGIELGGHPDWYGTPLFWNDRLYMLEMLDNRLTVFDVADPLEPRLLASKKLDW